jgi:tRNA dimethylallyltransferase
MGELLVIGGPTASGKTKAAIALATYLKCPILSADSRQFFREMSIGTAKPSDEELAQATHYFINNKSIEEDYSAGDYERDALVLLESLFLKHKYVVLVGGSGLYIDAVCKGMDELPKSSALRDELNAIFKRDGL